MLSEHLGEVVVVEAGVGGRGERHHAGDNGSVDGVAGMPAAVPVRERGGTVGAVRGKKAAHLTFGDAEQAGGLGDRDGGAEEGIQNQEAALPGGAQGDPVLHGLGRIAGLFARSDSLTYVTVMDGGRGAPGAVLPPRRL